MVTRGAGTVVEIVEYLGVILLPVTYVGYYVNNVQDLIANLVGALVGSLVVRAASGTVFSPRALEPKRRKRVG